MELPYRHPCLCQSKGHSCITSCDSLLNEQAGGMMSSAPQFINVPGVAGPNSSCWQRLGLFIKGSYACNTCKASAQSKCDLSPHDLPLPKRHQIIFSQHRSQQSPGTLCAAESTEEIVRGKLEGVSWYDIVHHIRELRMGRENPIALPSCTAVLQWHPLSGARKTPLPLPGQASLQGHSQLSSAVSVSITKSGHF